MAVSSIEQVLEWSLSTEDTNKQVSTYNMISYGQ